MIFEMPQVLSPSMYAQAPQKCGGKAGRSPTQMVLVVPSVMLAILVGLPTVSQSVCAPSGPRQVSLWQRLTMTPKSLRRLDGVPGTPAAGGAGARKGSLNSQFGAVTAR